MRLWLNPPDEKGGNKLFIKTGDRVKKILFSCFRWFFLVSVGYIILFPLIYMLSNAFKPLEQLMDPSIVWVPRGGGNIENFKTAIKSLDIPSTFFMSLRVGVVSALIEVLTCAVVAYGFARFEFKEKNFVFALVILTMIVPPQIIVVPLYMNFRHLDVFGVLGGIAQLTGADIRPNLLNTPWVFHIPSMLAVGVRSGLFVFIYHQFFKQLPKELEEAAWIDGSGPFQTFVKIILPSSGVVILTVSIFSVIWHWNEYFLSTMFLMEKKTLSVALAQLDAFAWSAQLQTGIYMAACLLFILPMLTMYLVLQRFFIKSIDRVGIVG